MLWWYQPFVMGGSRDQGNCLFSLQLSNLRSDLVYAVAVCCHQHTYFSSVHLHSFRSSDIIGTTFYMHSLIPGASSQQFLLKWALPSWVFCHILHSLTYQDKYWFSFEKFSCSFCLFVTTSRRFSLNIQKWTTFRHVPLRVNPNCCILNSD